MLYLVLIGAALIALLVFLFKKRLWGLILSVIGILAMEFCWTSYKFYTIMAENPGIMWKNEAGVPYRDIYTGNAEENLRYTWAAGAVVLVGLLWTLWQLIGRYKRKKTESIE